jgi:hypothetical protein
MQAADRQEMLQARTNPPDFTIKRQSRNNDERETLVNEARTEVSVVLVHGAWAEGSSWARVIKPLQSRD